MQRYNVGEKNHFMSLYAAKNVIDVAFSRHHIWATTSRPANSLQSAVMPHWTKLTHMTFHLPLTLSIWHFGAK